MVGVIRHGDRTPKQKMKMIVKHKKFIELFAELGGYKNGQLKIKKPKLLQVCVCARVSVCLCVCVCVCVHVCVCVCASITDSFTEATVLVSILYNIPFSFRPLSPPSLLSSPLLSPFPLSSPLPSPPAYPSEC